MNSKPTQEQIDTARSVLLYMIESTKIHEPNAFRSIKNMESVVCELYLTPDQIETI